MRIYTNEYGSIWWGRQWNEHWSCQTHTIKVNVNLPFKNCLSNGWVDGWLAKTLPWTSILNLLTFSNELTWLIFSVCGCRGGCQNAGMTWNHNGGYKIIHNVRDWVWNNVQYGEAGGLTSSRSTYVCLNGTALRICVTNYWEKYLSESGRVGQDTAVC